MTDALATYLVLIPALPLAAALITALLGPKLLKSQSHWPTILAFGGSFACSVALLFNVGAAEFFRVGGQVNTHVYSLWTWAAVSGDDWGDFAIDITLRADGLTALMLCMVTFISTLVAIFSVGYMKGDRGYWRFFTYIALFVFSMTMLVSVSNFLLLFVFWEAVGACSYLLIGFWYEKPSASAAGMKAFLVNRVGDFGFILGLLLIFTTYGTLNYHDVDDVKPAIAVAADSTSADADSTVVAKSSTETPAGVLSSSRITSGGYVTGATATVICLLLLLGACGKSAQFPLHVWLPDAMEGPTPVSALIHAATMVTAGVYMVTRCTPLFTAAPDAQVAVACIGGITALLAGLIAMTQFDLKRVLAYSTVSQLGYMFLALGVGSLAGISSGMFHLFTHAFFKALLFLAAGSVMHSMGNVIDMRQFGGLRRIMPITCVTFAAGAIALAGLVPFSGFWSKDAILGSVHDKSHAIAAEYELRHPSASGDDADHDEGEHAADAHHGPTDASVKALTDSQLQWHGWAYSILYWVGVATAFLTAFYTTRAFCMTFFGDEKVPPEAAGHAHESPPAMWAPLAILALFAVLFGGVAYWSDAFVGWLQLTPSLALGKIADTPALSAAGFHMDVAQLSTVVALLGVGLAAYLYLGEPKEITVLGWLFNFDWAPKVAESKWAWPGLQLKRPVVAIAVAVIFVVLVLVYGWSSSPFEFAHGSALGRAASIQAISPIAESEWAVSTYSASTRHVMAAIELAVRNLLFVLLVATLIWTAWVLLVFLAPIMRLLSPYKLSYGKFFIDEIYNVLIVIPLRVLAAISYWFDRWIIDGLVNLVGSIPPLAGSIMRMLQVGLVQFYALAMAFGVLLILFIRLLWS